MQRKTSILNVGQEQSYQKLRHNLLSEAGYTVFSVESASEAEALAAKKKIHMLVVGAWVSKAERNRVVRLVRERNRQARVIFYYDQTIDGTEEADAILNYRGDHSDLVRTVQHLLAKVDKQDRGGRGTQIVKHLAALVLTAPCWVGNVLALSAP